LEYFGLKRSHPVEYADDGVTRDVDEGSLASERFNYLQDLRSAENPVEARPQPLSTLVGATASFASLPFDMSTQVFASSIPVALSVRYESLRPRRSAGRNNFSLDVYAELRNSEAVVIDRLDRQLNFDLAPGEIPSSALLYLFALSAPAGDYQLHFVVRDNIGESLGTREETVTVPELSGTLALSGLVLADSVETLPPSGETATDSEPFTFGDVRVVPNPGRVFRQGEPMYLYFQAYGSGLSEGKSSLRVEYAFSRNGKPLWSPTQVSLDPTDRSERAVFSSFDTKRFPPGTYTLTVKVEDLVEGQSASENLSFTIR
jgi:hypothetical protein